MSLAAVTILSGIWLLSLEISYRMGGNAVLDRVFERLDENDRTIRK